MTIVGVAVYLTGFASVSFGTYLILKSKLGGKKK
jgi:hypothetical protein